MDYHILIAEDEPHIRSQLRVWLEEYLPKKLPANYFVYEAKDCTEVSARLAELKTAGKSLDLAIVDLLMPGKSGIEAIADLQQVSPSTRVVILSATASLRVEQLQEKYGNGVKVLDKPIGRAEFLDKIIEVLEGNHHA